MLSAFYENLFTRCRHAFRGNSDTVSLFIRNPHHSTFLSRRWRKMKHTARYKTWEAFRIFVLAVISLIVVFPFFWMIICSFKSSSTDYYADYDIHGVTLIFRIV